MTISAIITTYNRASIVIEAIQSVLDQNKPVAELIVVDDGSTDNSAETITQAFANAKVPCRYIRKSNGGMATSLNTGVAEATGEWVAFLDDDDLWSPDHIERISEIKALVPNAGCIAGLRNEGKGLQVPPSALLSEYKQHPEDADIFIHDQQQLTRPFFTPVVGTAAVRRDHVLATPFATEARARVDVHFFWRLSENTDIALDLRCHGTGRQYRVSLLSTDADAPESLKQQIVLKRNQDEIAMLQDLLRNRDPRASQEFRKLLVNAQIGRSYLLRSFNKYDEALKHLKTCVGQCPISAISKELLLATLHIPSRTTSN